MVPLTIPPDWVSVILLPYPLPAVSETSKPVGAVAVMFPVKLLPDTVNCWIFGLVEAVPAQAEMAPDPVVAVMAGGVTPAGYTVMVKVYGVPLQPVPGAIKLPKAIGSCPTWIVVKSAYVSVLKTKTEVS